MKTNPRTLLPTLLGGILLLAGTPPAWSQGSLDTWVDPCGITAPDLLQLLENEALIVDANTISQNHDGTWALLQQPYTQSGIQPPLIPLCTDSRFYGQPQVNGASFRSAVQVGPDLLLTAWHNPSPAVPPVVVVFGLRYSLFKGLCTPPDFSHIPASQVYWPIEVVADGFPLVGKDFLLLRLDRPASPTFPRVRRRGQGRPGDSMTNVAHPDRLATKVDLAGTLSGYAGSEPNILVGTQNIHLLIGSSGSMFYNRTEQFVETIARGAVGTTYLPPGPSVCKTVGHVGSPGFTHYSVKTFADFIPSFELLVSPLDTVVHVGPVGGPFTNPLTVRSIHVDDGAPQKVDYRLEYNGLTPQPQLVIQLDGGTAQGTLGPGDSFSSRETFKANLAPCGVYERTYRARDLTHGFTDTVRHRFEIGLGAFTVTPEEGAAGADAGKAARDTATYTITNTRPSPLMVTVTATSAAGPDWLLRNGVRGNTPLEIELPPFGTAAVTVAADPGAGLSPESRQATLTFAGNAGPGCPAVAGATRTVDFGR